MVIIQQCIIKYDDNDRIVFILPTTTYDCTATIHKQYHDNLILCLVEGTNNNYNK